MSKNKFDSGRASQEDQYEFPYHYIPSIENGNFTQHLYWSWGINYLSGLNLVFSLLSKEEFKSLVDIGCGDGRFLYEVDSRFKNVDLLGIDFSKQAIDLAKSMSRNIRYECINICSAKQPLKKFDVVTLIEVLEHIPIEQVDLFIESLAKYLKPSGRLIITVPHRNKAVSSKHFQHFDSESLYSCLSSFFEVESLCYFEKKSRFFNYLVNPFLRNKIFILNNKFLLNRIFRFYRKYLVSCNENKCGRILFVGKKR